MKSNDFYHGIIAIIVWMLITSIMQCSQFQNCYDELRDIKYEIQMLKYK